MRSEIVRDPSALAGLNPAWGALWAASATRPVTLHPAWIEAWWSCLGGEGELVIVACHEGDALVGLAPFYLAPPRGVPLRGRELKLIGDRVVGARRAVLVRAGEEPAVLDEAVSALSSEHGWDVLDLALADGGEARELGRRFAALGRAVEEVGPANGRPEVPLDEEGRKKIEEAEPASPLPLRRYGAKEFPAALQQMLDLLRSGHGPTAEPAFVDFVARAAPALHGDGAAILVGAASDEKLIAGALLLRDGARWIELAEVVAPGSGPATVAPDAIRLAIAEGAESIELATTDSPLATVRSAASRLRVYGPTQNANAPAPPSGIIQRGYASLVRRASDQIGRLRASAPDVVQRVVAQVATFARLHLYRGELFVRGGAPPSGANLRLFTLADFEAHPDREGLVAHLGLAEAYCRQKWERGDTVVLAELDGQPVGILWCARVPVHVPDIGREVRPLSGECYIHDVYVSPEARGRALAPSMLDFLARDLRARDVYRAWALIERSNSASTRAFEKAAYASVADVIYARMGMASKLLVRPPDEEARAFLGLPPRRR
jgi:ribosomal protein S18 acetylase RimI-like enzyme